MPRRSDRVNNILALAASVEEEHEFFKLGLSSEEFIVLTKNCKNETEVLDLARRVMTEAGARYFGVPIGTLITPDKEDDAKALHGGRPAPPRSVAGSNQKRAGTSEYETNDTPSPGKRTDENRDLKDVQNGWASKGFMKNSLSGTMSVVAGKVEYKVPEGSTVYRSPKHKGRVYVVTPTGETHVYTSAGELDLTPQERLSLTSQVQNQLTAVTSTSADRPGEEEKEEREVTWVRLVSIARQIAQAESVGDESLAKKLEEEFRALLSSYAPEKDPRAVRSEITRGNRKAK